MLSWSRRCRLPCLAQSGQPCRNTGIQLWQKPVRHLDCGCCCTTGNLRPAKRCTYDIMFHLHQGLPRP